MDVQLRATESLFEFQDDDALENNLYLSDNASVYKFLNFNAFYSILNMLSLKYFVSTKGKHKL